MDTQPDDILHILVIDDDPAMRDLFLQLLTLDGHQVVAVASAEEGLGQLPWYTFQVAFLDQNLPGMEGLVLGEYLRRNNPHMHIALVTGEEDPRLERISREHDITFIAKPFDVSQVRDVVERAMHQAEARRQRRHEEEDPHHAPALAEYFHELPGIYGLAGVPQRLEAPLVTIVRRSLNNLRSVSRYNERDRVTALAGLLTAQVLGLELPHSSDGRTLFELYDEAMAHHGRRLEFSAAPVPPDADQG